MAIQVLGSIIFVYLGGYALYFLVFAVAGFFYRDKPIPAELPRKSVAVFIPGYKEDRVIVDVAEAAAAHESLHYRFDVVVIADSFEAGTLAKLHALPIRVIEVSFEKSTKSKALNRAMEVLDKPYDYAVVLDADNVMAEGFLDKACGTLESGFRIVQGHRQDKNQNTRFAILDAVSEGVNNAIFRKGHRVFGLSAALIGSGFAVEYGLFKEVMGNIQAVGGFDKELEIRLIKDRVKIGFCDNAVVLDEKVQQADVFTQQRRRWLSAQFVYFSRYFLTACGDLLKRGNVDLFDKVMQMLAPPRVILVGLTALISLVVFLAGFIPGAAEWLFPGFYHWISLFGLSVLSIAVATPAKFYRWTTVAALLELPRAFFLMLLALFRIKGANKRFIHTRHGDNRQDD